MNLVLAKTAALLISLVVFISEIDLFQDAAFEIFSTCGRMSWAADQHINSKVKTEFSRHFGRVDLICPEASMNGAVNVMRCHRAPENSAVNRGMWERRQYASVVLLVPDAYGWTVP